MSDTDQEIIDQVRAGKTRRYAILVDRHKDRAFALAHRLIGERCEAEEVAQDAFVKAYKNLDQFRGDAKFSTWLHRIVYNLCMTRVTRRRERSDHLDVGDDRISGQILVDAEELSIQDQLEYEEMQGIIAGEIEVLPEKFRSVITLFYVHEMSYEEIASVLTAPLGTVKTNLFRARDLLKERVLRRMKGEMRTG